MRWLYENSAKFYVRQRRIEEYFIKPQLYHHSVKGTRAASTLGEQYVDTDDVQEEKEAIQYEVVLMASHQAATADDNSSSWSSTAHSNAFCMLCVWLPDSMIAQCVEVFVQSISHHSRACTLRAVIEQASNSC
ncbi:Uncharacterized protein BM_BM12631 [Brugia malayi]|uniref:Uncharacterized protein n=2 Tax=Brugia TaxID=6278 RepID=A0A4E9EUA6_BRUMA|nr:Uncharacterized protein BM_BM12631 [Brugia malayi]VIO87811.1 Uncharacterized protein BM_BM12631 [Brugia malayi]